jgi:hypothetical protein
MENVLLIVEVDITPLEEIVSDVIDHVNHVEIFLINVYNVLLVSLDLIKNVLAHVSTEPI